MKTLTEFTQEETDSIKIKLQGFLYTNREDIFKKDTLPKTAINYPEEALITLAPLTEAYKDLLETSLGILTSSHVELNDKKCIACQRCTRFCPSQALEKIGVDLVLHKDKCISCGNCIGNCPFLALKAPETGLGVYIKNKFSDKPYILPSLYKAEELEVILTKINNFFLENSFGEETLSDVVARVGFETLLSILS